MTLTERILSAQGRVITAAEWLQMAAMLSAEQDALSPARKLIRAADLLADAQRRIAELIREMS